MTSGVGVSVVSLVCRLGGNTILDQLSLAIAPGEFMVLLGPSGCGKTTLLRAIAGFQRPDAGEIRIGDRLVSGPGRFVPAERRGLGFVFQSYALWPHMTVSENVGFGLHRHPDRAMRVAAALRAVGLEDFGDRRPATLSGGQRQRVALARCLAKAPGLILMDEPLANLDPALRGAVQTELAAVRRDTGATILYVTHDRAEALALADRIALIGEGRVLQCDSPAALYERPATPDVARLLGATLLPCTVQGSLGDGQVRASVFNASFALRSPPGMSPGPALVSLHPHDVVLGSGIPALLQSARYQGDHYRLRVRLADATELDVPHHGDPPPDGTAIEVALRDGWVLG